MLDLLARVVNTIAKTTRYPKHLLTEDADLENDLGIDSVKRVEIIAALADEFQLDLANQVRDPSIRTIQQIAEWIASKMEAASASSDQNPPARNASSPSPAISTPEPAVAAHPRPNELTAPHGTIRTVALPHPPAWESTLQPSSTTLDLQHEQHTNTLPPLGKNGSAAFAEIHHANGSAHESTNGSAHESASWNQTPWPRAPKRGAIGQQAPVPTTALPLNGRVALVTGSGRGVGRTIARILASRGATVIVNSFHSRQLGDQTTAEINATGGVATHIWGSVANPDHVQQLFGEVESQFGFLDILVCNASDGRIGSFTEITPADWDRAFRTNVSGHHLCAMHAAQLMQRRGGGSIVTMSSIAAQRYVQGLGGQGVIKAAVESMTRYLACELAAYGIRVNCVSGGPVYGEVMAQYHDARKTFNYWESIVPDGELCSPLDLAHTIAFLVSDEARGINGAVWTVDHGASTRAHSRPLPAPAVASPQHTA